MRRNVLALAGVAVAVGALTGAYFWPTNEGPFARLEAGPPSVRYDADTMRLTATVDIRNGGSRQTVASITNAVWIDSKKHSLSDRNTPQPWRAELATKQSSPVIFVLEGETAAAVWNGVQLMELTIYAGYDANERLHCDFNFAGRFYPLSKEIGIVSSVTSPAECRGR